MTTFRRILFAAPLATTLLAGVAVAQPAAPSFNAPATVAAAPAVTATVAAPADDEARNSINVSPLGLLIGSYNVNYERLFDGGHGVIVEGGYTDWGSDDNGYTSFNAGVGYRWHWQGEQNSGFLGLTVHASTASASVTVDGESVDVDLSGATVTGNIGKRWMLSDNVNITLRAGAGRGIYTATASSTVAEDKASGYLNGLAFDGELSLGANF